MKTLTLIRDAIITIVPLSLSLSLSFSLFLQRDGRVVHGPNSIATTRLRLLSQELEKGEPDGGGEKGGGIRSGIRSGKSNGTGPDANGDFDLHVAAEMTGVIGEEDFERAIEMISKEVSRGPPKKTLGEFRPQQRSYSE